MPIRTYTNTDFINYVAGFFFNSGTDTVGVVSGSQFNVQLTANGSDNVVAGEDKSSSANARYDITAELDFDVFPAIPSNAVISKVEVQIDVEVSGVATATVDGLNGTNVNAYGNLDIQTWIDSGILPDIRLTASASDDAPGEMSASINVFDEDHYTATQTYDYSGSPIDKATLVATFTNWSIFLIQTCYGQAIISALFPGTTGTTAETSSIDFQGIRVTVTYESGAEVYTIDPSGGNVEPGQTLTVTGPNADELTYAAIAGDLVIPIVPKIVSPTEVILEVPFPSSEDCLNCFDDCPECDACATSCAEDLEGEECQACLQSCLDCLAACLENLELAEACQESTPPTTIVIVVSGTQFSGSVTLGTFVILTAEASGIYRFVDGKTNDTLYSTARDGTTYDVKIPDPGGKTGFFRK